MDSIKKIKDDLDSAEARANRANRRKRREAKLYTQIKECMSELPTSGAFANRTADMWGMGNEEGNGKRKVSGHAGQAASIYVADTLGEFNIPGQVKSRFSGMEREAGHGGHGITQGTILVDVEITPVKGMSQIVEVPVYIKNGYMLQPAIMFHQGTPMVIAQSAIDDLVESGMLSGGEIKTDRRHIYAPPGPQKMDAELSQHYASMERNASKTSPQVVRLRMKLDRATKALSDARKDWLDGKVSEDEVQKALNEHSQAVKAVFDQEDKDSVKTAKLPEDAHREVLQPGPEGKPSKYWEDYAKDTIRQYPPKAEEELETQTRFKRQELRNQDRKQKEQKQADQDHIAGPGMRQKDIALRPDDLMRMKNQESEEMAEAAKAKARRLNRNMEPSKQGPTVSSTTSHEIPGFSSGSGYHQTPTVSTQKKMIDLKTRRPVAGQMARLACDIKIPNDIFAQDSRVFVMASTDEGLHVKHENGTEVIVALENLVFN